MGALRIVESLGEGLFRGTLEYNRAPLDTEVTRLEAEQTQYWTKVLEALQTLDRLRQAKADAREGMDAVIDQWQQGLIDKLNETAPEIPPPVPNDPATGQPWEDPDRAQDGPLFTAINAARTAAGKNALSRDDALDTAILWHLRSLAATGSTQVNGAFGTTPANRVWQAGYLYDATVGVGLVQAFGTRDVAATLAKWLRSTSDKASLLNDNYTEIGVAYVYRPGNPYTYLWGAILATPGPPPGQVEPDDNPAEEASEETAAELERIKAPKVEDFSPQNLAKVAGEFAKAARQVVAAEKEIARLRIENLERERRMGVLKALQNKLNRVLHVWAVNWDAWLQPGEVAQTAEVPGWWLDAGTAMTTTMGKRGDPDGIVPDYEVAYTEYQINIVPPIAPQSRLRYSETMSDAAIFINAALEPGHLKWKPLWRYGTITALGGDMASVSLTPMAARLFQNERAMALDTEAQETLNNVPIEYPPCNGQRFEVGHEVLIFFGFDRATPKIIGFRREPLPCPGGGRMSWLQLSTSA
jgi:uncharacterized protein YkwD